MNENIVFSEVLNEYIGEDKYLLEKTILLKAFYVGALSNAVKGSSFHSKVSKENENFFKWLSTVLINEKNIIYIKKRADEFIGKLKLSSKRVDDINIEIAKLPMKSKSKVFVSEINEAFYKGFYLYSQFKKDYPSKKQGVENE